MLCLKISVFKCILKKKIRSIEDGMGIYLVCRKKIGSRVLISQPPGILGYGGAAAAPPKVHHDKDPKKKKVLRRESSKRKRE